MKKIFAFGMFALIGLVVPLRASTILPMPVDVSNPATIPTFLDTARMDSLRISALFGNVKADKATTIEIVKKVKTYTLVKEVSMPALRVGPRAGAKGKLVNTQVKYVTAGGGGPTTMTLEQKLPGIKLPRIVSGVMRPYINGKGVLREILIDVRAPFVNLATVSKDWRADRAFVHYFRRALRGVLKL